MNEKNPFAFLPVPERYVENPAGQAVKVSIIVPVYNEFQNGNLLRIVDAFSRQSAPGSSFEVLCLVNNSREDATHNSSVFTDNQKALEFGSILNSGLPAPDSLSDYQKGVVDRARKKSLSIHFIDLTQGGVDKNMGIARQAGVIEAVKRFREAGNLEEGIIAHMDADTIVKPNYINKLTSLFGNSQTEAVFLNLDYVLHHGTQELYETSKKNELKFWCDRLQRVLFNRPIVGSPQIAARASVHQALNGIPLRHTGEDLVFAQILQEKKSVAVVPDPTVYTSDRARLESFDGRGRLLSMKFVDAAECQDPTSSILSNIFSHLRHQFPDSLPPENLLSNLLRKCNAEVRLEVLDSLYGATGISSDTFYAALKTSTQVFTQAPLKPYEYSEKVKSLLFNWATPDEHMQLENMIKRETRKSKIRHHSRRKVLTSFLKKLPDISPKTHEVLEQNPWMIDVIQVTQQSGSTTDEVFDKISGQYPDLLGDWNEDLHGAIANVKGMYLFLLGNLQNKIKGNGVTQLLGYL